MKRTEKHKGKMFIIGCLVVLACAFVSAGGAHAADFPLRAEYPMVTPVETEELAGMFDKVIIVDSRNQSEFDVIHMVGAKNILVGKMKESDLLSLRPKKDDTMIVFYCNGVTCSKSYKASKKAVEWGFSNVKCYDAGIFTWSKAHPEKTEFFGKVLSAEELQKVLFDDTKFKSVSLAPKDFMDMTKDGSYTIFDIRDPNERSETPFTLPMMKVMSFDTMVGLINKKSPAVPKSKLLIVDNVGKQVRWLQYYFDREKFTDYYFIKGGLLELKKQGF